MIKLLFGADQQVIHWVMERLPGLSFDRCTAIGVTAAGQIIAGAVYHNYVKDYGNIEMTVASATPRWATRRVISTLLHYPFTQLGCGRVTATCREGNTHAVNFNLRLGFKKEGILRKGCGHEDMVIMGMLKEEAVKWLGR